MKISRNYSKKIGIYCIYNRKNRKIYIGSSINIYNRLNKHLSDFRIGRHQNIYLRSAINKYKIENFTCFILEECEKEELLQREQYWINILKPEYNLTKEVLRNTLSTESRKKVSQTLKLGYKNGTIKFTRTRKIDVYLENGDYQYSFDYIRQAAKYLKLDPSSIHRVLSGIYKQANGYQFKYSEDKKEVQDITKKPKLKKSKNKKVIVKDLKTNKEYLFNSLKECNKFFNFRENLIWKCLKRKNNKGIYKNKFSFTLPR